MSLANQNKKAFPVEHQNILLDLARRSIRYGLESGRILEIPLDGFPPELQERRGTFVTLHKKKNLRGCIGNLEACSTILEGVLQNSFQAAFRDPRFQPLQREEWPEIRMHISILSASEKFQFESESDLLTKIRPGIDGLILEEGRNCGTFLPAVWESLPEAEEFWMHLKLKAGLPVDYWSRTLQVSRYTAHNFGDPN